MLEDILNDFREEVVTLFRDRKYGNFLDCISRFYNYSPRNILLIYAQNKNATSVASYTDWKRHGYQVKKGEKGIKIIRPIKFIDDATGEEVINFRTGYVFDISQVICKNPKPDPKPDFDLEMALESLLLDARTNIKIVDDIPEIQCRGYYSRTTNEIVIKRDTIQKMFEVLLHEKRHSLRTSRVSTDIEEVIVECAAYVASKHFGIERDTSSMYVANFCKDNSFSEIDTFLVDIINLSKKLINWVKKNTHLQGKESVA